MAEVDEVKKINYGCTRRILNGKLGTETACLDGRNMDVMVEAETWNANAKLGKLGVPKFSMDYVAMHAIHEFAKIEDLELQSKVVKMVYTTVVSNKDPFTGRQLRLHSVTLQMVKDMIAFADTGDLPSKRISRNVYLSPNDISTLESMLITSEHGPIGEDLFIRIVGRRNLGPNSALYEKYKTDLPKQRDYKKEYAVYHSRPEQIAKRTELNRRAKMKHENEQQKAAALS